MDLAQVKALLRSIDLRQEPFYYYKDKYAVDQLAEWVGPMGTKMFDVKRSNKARYLEKPLIRERLAHLRDDKIRKEDLEAAWPAQYQVYRQHLSKWGEKGRHRKQNWLQTTRPGYSLVLQLNFTGEIHDEAFGKLCHPEMRDDFHWDSHPVHRKLNTLGWVRIDWEPGSHQALIEEVQTDWIRNVRRSVESLLKVNAWERTGIRREWFYTGEQRNGPLWDYYVKTIRPLEKIWDETLLHAAMQFLRNKLKIHQVFYHTYEGGSRLKDCSPPRSLYTSLPKKFGFELTGFGPDFIRQCRYLQKTLRKMPDLKWFRSDF